LSHSPESDSFSFLSQFKVGKQTASSDWSQDLLLMNHYTRATCLSFSNVKSIQIIWQSLVPEIAADHKFLMHGLLALSAFHLCHLRPSERSKFVALANHHQGLALSHFRPVLPSITEDNCKPAVCMAIVLSVIGISALSRPRDSHSDTSGLLTSSFHDILGVFSLTRGVAGVLVPAQVWLQHSPINVMFHNWQLDSYDAIHLHEEVQNRFDTLKHEIVPSLVADATSNLGPCLAALDQLVEIYKEVQFYSTSQNTTNYPVKCPVELEIGILLKWTTNVPAEFVMLLRQQHTAALIILAHYVITMMSLGDRWFSRNWSENALQIIKEVIDPSGLPWLRWPEDNLRKQQESWRTAMIENPSDRVTKLEDLNLDRNGFYQTKVNIIG
jgi:Fungal specific transcription factor domain